MVYSIAKCTFIPFYKLWLRKVEGMENIPTDTSFIIALNHVSYYDAILPYVILIPKLNKQVHALANSRYWKLLPAKIILDLGKCIPVYVGKDNNPKKNEAALQKAAKFLRKGNLIQIFPEGTRSPDGKLQKGYSGVARLSLQAKVPVVPIGVIGANKVLPKGKLLPRLKRCDVKIGKPMYFTEYYNKKINNKVLEDMTRKIMKNIAKLIGQEYNY